MSDLGNRKTISSSEYLPLLSCFLLALMLAGFVATPVSAGQINVQLNNYAREINAGALSLNGAKNGGPETTDTNTNTGQYFISTTVPTQTDNSWVVDVVGSGDEGSFLPGDNQIEWYDQSTYMATGAGSYKITDAASSYTMTQEHCLSVNPGGNCLGWAQESNRNAHVVASFAPASGQSIVRDNTSGASDDWTNSLSWDHTVGSGSNRKLLVGIAIEDDENDVTATEVTHNGQQLTRVAATSVTTEGYTQRVELWYLDLPPLFPSPQADYHMDELSWEGNSGEVIDSTGNGHNGTAENGADTVDPGKLCRAGSFDGSDDYVQVDGLSNLLDGTASLAFWIKTNQTGNDDPWQAPGVTGKEIEGEPQDDIYWGWIDGSGHIGMSVGDTLDAHSSATIDNGSWHHVVLTRNAATARYKIYINGTLDESGYHGPWYNRFTGEIPVNFSSLGRIQDDAGTPEYFQGELDEVIVFDGVLSDSEVQNGYNNQLDGYNWNGTERICPSFLDHLEILHDSQGLTCRSEPIEIRVCADSNCDEPYSDEVTVNFNSPSSGWNPDPVTFSGGNTTVDLTHTTPETVTLNATAESPQSSAPTQCFTFEGTETCNLTFQNVGIVFDGDDSDPEIESDIVSQIAGKPSGTAPNATTQRIRVIRTDENTGACKPGVANETLNATFSYLLPEADKGLEDNIIAINPTSGASQQLVHNGSTQTIELDFNSNGTAPFHFTSEDAGKYAFQVDLDIPVTNSSGQETGEVIPATDISSSFVVRPLTVFVDAVNATGDSNPQAQDAFDGVFTVAGKRFELQFRSLGWTIGRDNDPTDGQWDACGNASINSPDAHFARVPSWDIGKPDSDLQKPDGGVNGTLAYNDGNAVFIEGGHQVNALNVTYDEVGIIQLQKSDISNFLGKHVSVCSPYIGRFIPDHFQVSNSTISFRNACPAGNFTYIGQSFYYDSAPSITLTAENVQNATTNNYGGNFWKFPNTPPYLGNRYYIDQAIATASFNPNRSDVAEVNGQNNFDGRFTFSLHDGLSGDQFRYEKNGTEDPFNATVDLILKQSDLEDDDDVCYQVNGSCSDYTIEGITGTELRYGRAVVENAYGSDLRPLTNIGVRAEYYDGSSFKMNTNDTCTTYNATEIDWSSATYSEQGNLTSSDLASSGDGTFEDGEGSFSIHKNGDPNSGPEKTGYVDYRFPMPTWLHYDWNDNGTRSDPPARATFGIYKGNEHIIYQQETTWK